MFSFPTAVLLFSSALLARAAVTQADFSGLGNIHVLNSSDWRTVTLDQQVGCIDKHGNFITGEDASECGVFYREPEYPWTLSTDAGNCTFKDTTRERNTDSRYGKSTYAWSCTTPHEAIIYDELYTIDGFPEVFLCHGDIVCYYDAKRAPEGDEKLSLWQFKWGSGQRGITPGHIQLLLLWKKIGDLPKREGEKKTPGPRIELHDGLQIPLQGEQAES
ncbi:hypothetical protein BS50DRAFT_212438 [Corynespora cassiicola Philippines]|uniref:Secreted protein n=1 Tax=Corynespora cassiicola Philippines TaxID=1448308 RepID=A0A2T2N5E5_CORCC|nr:hypothetical protein BS50DRAFT_212438 [Corynespora cassiicola Philippines]